MDLPIAFSGFEVPLHRALTEPVLLGGAPRGFAILNGTLAAAIGLGFSITVTFLSAALNLWVPMIGRSWMTGASIEATLELWASSLRDVKADTFPVYAGRRCRVSGAFPRRFAWRGAPEDGLDASGGSR